MTSRAAFRNAPLQADVAIAAFAVSGYNSPQARPASTSNSYAESRVRDARRVSAGRPERRYGSTPFFRLQK